MTQSRMSILRRMANSSMNNASKNQDADLMRLILNGMGIEHDSVDDFRKNDLGSIDFTADNILSRLEGVAEKIEQSQLEQLQSDLETLFSPRGSKSRARAKIREIFIKAIDKWIIKKKKNGSAIYDESWEGCLIKALCNSEEHFHIFSNVYGEETLPPFHHAAAEGDHDTIQFMILTHEQQSDGSTDEILRGLAMQYKNETAFELATKHMRYNVVQLLYTSYPTLVDSIRLKKTSCIENFIKATSDLEKQADKTEGKTTKLQKALEIFDIIICNTDPSDWLPDVWKKAVEEKAMSILIHLMKEKVNSSFITNDRASFIIKEGTYDMWQLLSNETLKDLFTKENCRLLHDAVSSGKCEIVEDILQRFPQQIEACIANNEGKLIYALELLAGHKLLLEDMESYDRLRNLLVHAMIRSDLAIQTIKEIGNNSKVEIQSMTLHFPNFDTTSQSFTKYIKSLKDLQSDYMKFEAVLKYASFPDLEEKIAFSQGSSVNMFGTDHSEICDAVQWLKGRKVTEILELVVSDRLHSPHRDDQVIDCVNNLHVRILDWKKPDLYLPGLETDHIQHLTLYSSGNQSVIDQWCNELPKFTKLEELDIRIIEDLVRETRAKNTENWLSSLKEKMEFLGLKAKITVNSCQWFSPSEKMAVYRNLGDITLDVAGIELKAFIDKFKAYYRENEKETNRPPRMKIALVDSGVVAVSRQSSEDPQPENEIDISRRIVDGVSYINKDNREYLWWHASEPHGTQMATIICAINPCCHLYIAKVAETKTSSLSVANVTEAIKWAIQKKVDIISLSLVVYAQLPKNNEQSNQPDQSEKLMEAINEAKRQDIIIICSTADEGHSAVQDILNKSDNREKVISISACSQQGKPLEQSQEDGFIYRFSGDKIQLGTVPFLKSDNHVTGSSVATAIAAATASLILSCCHISTNFNTPGPNTPGPNTPWKRDTVIERFGDMSDDTKSARLGPWVRPQHLCGRDRLNEKFDFTTLINEAYCQVKKDKEAATQLVRT
ncbi:hypothetical protein TRIATDRAFT_322237 [Trichoderma atroviride IMI 206040]|uniref:Peptidase S8/S53 domain-containing protein n=1 Tax=Hypocrea atroviridis (strain ATCC 20476 / IMI 206040) TaxID=452589 RepID=G9P5G7_HYPAI|nr:uncharacterized protein TRIATDRAFT_322237 [Trichoderma atroviride IMI 206040]EHK42138.1 hypothetical protein TRIATDRAFT_322237 [Trichoderma atroviride IMI 206040]